MTDESPSSPSQTLNFEATIESLVQEIAWLHYRWQLFTRLFAFSRERIDQLNLRAGHVFGLYQRVLWDAVLLDIAKLLNWRGSSNRAVVSLHRAIHLLPDSLSAQTKAELEQRFTALRTTHESIIEHRDRRIAHNDVAIVSEVDTLDGISRAQVQSAMSDIVATLNAVAMPAGKGEHRFDVRDGQADFEADVMCHLLISGDWEVAEQELEQERREHRSGGLQ